MSTGLSYRKRSKIGPVDEASGPSTMAALQEELEGLRLWRETLLGPVTLAGTFDLQHKDEKVRLVRSLWDGDFAGSLAALKAANPQLVEVLRAQVSNGWDARRSEAHATTKERLVDGILMCMVRAQSKFNMTLPTAALSCMARAGKVPNDFHEAVRQYFNGALTTTRVETDLLRLARDLRPPPAYEALEGLAIAPFDNLSMRLNYSSYVRDGQGGERKDMTNWLWTQPPRSLAPATLDVHHLCRLGCSGIFRTDLSLSHFCRLFYLDSPAVKANRSSRWTKFFLEARNGTLLDRPRVKPTWKPHKHYEPPIFDKLQSSTQHVREELDEMRHTLKGKGISIFFAAGDGLALMRVNHVLRQHHDVYLDQTPVTIPLQGENPHGLFHGMHCQWRLYRPFLLKCAAELQNSQIVEDPTVSVYNVHRFFLLNIVMPATMEYLLEISDDPAAGDISDPGPFMAKAAANCNLDMLTHFLHDNAFWVLEFLQSVRANESKTLDVLWTEFFSSAHTDTAHKTQYVGMSILRVFWAEGLCDDLQALYHAIRTCPNGKHDGCGVGWDLTVEDLNGAIKSHVDLHVSETQISNFVADWPFLEAVQEQMRELLYANCAERHWRGRDVRKDIDTLKAFFRRAVGASWARASRPDSTMRVTVAGRNAGRKPWKEVQAVMARSGEAAPHKYIKKYVEEMTPFFPWAS